MSKFTNFKKIDLDIATNGKWFKFDDNISFKIAKFQNPKHKRRLQAQQQAVDRYEERGDFVRRDRINAEILAETILLGWKGVEYEGKVVEYDQAKGAEMILDQSLGDNLLFISDCASNKVAFEEVEEKTVKK